MKTLPQPWTVAIEATIFTGWIYDHPIPHATQVKVAHPLMLRAIAAAKKKNDRIDAGKIADCLRCDFLPKPYGVHRDSVSASHVALPAPAGTPDGSDEESHLGTADGNRREPQQTAPTRGEIFSGAAGNEQGHR
jgi:hypothetical protein